MGVLIALFALAVTSVQVIFPPDFYVSTTGNDTAAGTLAAPFATLPRARAAVQTLLRANPTRNVDVRVSVRGGTYYLTAPLTFTAADSGTATARVIYQAFPGEKPVFSGAIRLNNWTVALPATTQNFAQLYVNGQRRYRPRTTRGSYLRNTGSTGSDRFKFNPGDLAATYANLSDIEVISFENAGASRLRLQSIDSTSNTAQVSNPAVWITGHRYLMENVKEAFTQPGDWYLDRATFPWTVAYLPRPGEDLATAVIEAPQVAQILTAANLTNVTFSGLTFAHDNWTIPATGYASTPGEVLAPAAVSLSGASGVIFDGCTITHTAAWGIEFRGGANNQIVNSLLYDLGAGGIRITGASQSNTLQNNALAGGGRFLPGAPGISINNAHHNTITRNDIADFYHSGLEVNAHDDTVSFNHISQIGQGVTNDMGGIYFASGSQTGNQILNNRIHDVTHALQDADGFGGWGIDLDGASNLTIQNNAVYRTAATSLFNNKALGNTISNNVFAFGATGLVQNGRPAVDGQSFQFTGNIGYFTSGLQATPSDWYCNDAAGAPATCTSRFLFDSNQYFNPGSATLQFLLNADPLQSSKILKLTLAQWRVLGEDRKSQTGNPLLGNPSFPADDFRVTANSPALALGFTAFDPAAAGRTAALLYPTPLDPAWPLRQFDAVADYQQPATVATPATTVNSASFRGGSFSANSIAAVFGNGLATAAVAALTPSLPLAIGGTSVTVRDSLGITRQAPLYFVSASQVNYVIPAGTAPGNATISILGPGTVATGTLAISGTAPGLYSADGTGRGTAAAGITTIHSDGSSDFTLASGGPIDLSRPDDQVFCTLYGTGIRNRTLLENVSLQLGSVTVPALYAGTQPSYEGFDQINFRIPRSLAGKGTVSLLLTADNATSNSVTLSFR